MVNKIKSRRNFNVSRASPPTTGQIKLLDNLFLYYSIVCLSPILSKINSKRKVIIRVSWLAILPYIGFRIWCVVCILYDALLITGAFTFIHGKPDQYVILEAICWMFVACMGFCSDVVFLDFEFHKVFRQFQLFLSELFVMTELDVAKTLKRAVWKSWRYILFSGFVDIFEIKETIGHLQPETTYSTFFYSIVPYQDPAVIDVAFLIQRLNVSFLLLCLSMTTTVSGCISYYVEAALDVLDESLSKCSGPDSEKNALKYFQKCSQLHYIVGRLSRKIGLGVMVFYSLYAAQQGAQTFVVFQTLRAGGSVEDLRLLFTDMILSGSRLIHSFHALSVADNASDRFLQGVKDYLMRNRGKLSAKAFKAAKLAASNVKPISMTVGGFRCHQDFLLTGMDIFSNIYFTAALWQ